ncbi:MAG: hypothetical protein ACFFBD_29385 [Candidatus Hodarchaeota archaeon]
MKNATRITVSAFGAIAGIAGIEHGIGEILQGPVVPGGIVIESWPNSQLYEILSGEPAMTIVPNLLVTGVLAIIFSLIFMIWAIGFIHKKYGGLVLILLSLILLLVGGGFTPPILGTIIGLAATRVNSEFNEWNNYVSTRNLLAKIWPYSLIISLFRFFSLWPGLIILAAFGIQEPFIALVLVFLSFGTLFLSIFSAFAYDNKIKGKDVDSHV